MSAQCETTGKKAADEWRAQTASRWQSDWPAAQQRLAGMPYPAPASESSEEPGGDE